jgi:GAF domain-containing protein
VSVEDTGSTAHSSAALMRDLAGLVLAHDSLSSALNSAAVLICAAIGGADDVSVTLADGQPRTVACSGELALRADESQYDVDAGPCLQALETNEPVRVEDLETEPRWPEYRPGALAAGVRSSLSLPLQTEGLVVGALNIYSRTPGSFDDDAESRAVEVANYAGVILSNAELYYVTADRADQMHEAMESRAVIEQAKGILMAQNRCDADEAFNLLVRMSQTSHRKLRDVAASVVSDVVTG